MAPNGGPRTSLDDSHSWRHFFTHLLPASTHAHLSGLMDVVVADESMDGLKSTPHFKTHDRSVVPPHDCRLLLGAAKIQTTLLKNAIVGAKRCNENRSVTRSRRYGEMI